MIHSVRDIRTNLYIIKLQKNQHVTISKSYKMPLGKKESNSSKVAPTRLHSAQHDDKRPRSYSSGHSY